MYSISTVWTTRNYLIFFSSKAWPNLSLAFRGAGEHCTSLHWFGPARPGVSPNSSRCIKKSVASVRNLPVEYSRVVFLGGKTGTVQQNLVGNILILLNWGISLHVCIWYLYIFIIIYLQLHCVLPCANVVQTWWTSEDVEPPIPHRNDLGISWNMVMGQKSKP